MRTQQLTVSRLVQSKQRKEVEEQLVKPFQWSDAFEQLQHCESGLLLVILESLNLDALRKTAMASKSFWLLIKGNRSFFEHPAIPSISTLYCLEDRRAFAPVISQHHLESRPVLFKSHRKILFDWLVDVQGEYQLSIESLHTSFALIDRCLQLKPNWPTGSIQLLGATSLFIASKFCCEGVTHPSVSDFVWVCDNAFTREEHSKMEIDILTLVSFVVRAVTPCSFIEGWSELLQLSSSVKAMANYLADLFLLEAVSVGTPPAAIAEACIILAIHNVEEVGVASAKALKDLEFLSRTSRHEIGSLVCKVQQLHYIDYLTNGNGKDKEWAQRAAIGQTPLRAVYERHSVVNSNIDPSAKPASLIDPKPLALLSPTNTSMPRCYWCRESACADALAQNFPGFTQLLSR